VGLYYQGSGSSWYDAVNGVFASQGAPGYNGSVDNPFEFMGNNPFMSQLSTGYNSGDFNSGVGLMSGGGTTVPVFDGLGGGIQLCAWSIPAKSKIAGVVEFKRTLSVTSVKIETGGGVFELNVKDLLAENLKDKMQEYGYDFLRKSAGFVTPEMSTLEFLAKAVLPSGYAARMYIQSIEFKVKFTLSVRTKRYTYNEHGDIIEHLDENWSKWSTYATVTGDLNATVSDGGLGALVTDYTGMVKPIRLMIQQYQQWVKKEVVPAEAAAEKYYSSQSYNFGGWEN
jgi:hypothetical protein